MVEEDTISFINAPLIISYHPHQSSFPPFVVKCIISLFFFFFLVVKESLGIHWDVICTVSLVERVKVGAIKEKCNEQHDIYTMYVCG